jgi:catechol 2,3-dioxygenase-like lactoylglutathione lyase family enzyme
VIAQNGARPDGMLGLRHVALFVQDLEACVRFYIEVLGMQLEWQPDPDNYYLTSGADNLALHRLAANKSLSDAQRLDHIGFILKKPEDVDAWHAHFVQHAAKSFYCADPAGNTVQMIYHPPISDKAS